MHACTHTYTVEPQARQSSMTSPGNSTIVNLMRVADTLTHTHTRGMLSNMIVVVLSETTKTSYEKT